jgi:TonB family protein
MFEEFPRSPKRPLPFSPDSAEAAPSAEPEEGEEEAPYPSPIVLSTFARKAADPNYRWSTVFSVVLHVSLIGLTLWLNRKIILPRAEAIPIALRKPPPPRPPPTPAERPQAVRKGSRGITLPKAVAPDIQPEFELSFAAPVEEEATGPSGRWIGGVGNAAATGPGSADGVEGGVIIRRSRARDPQELNTGWPCNFPEGEADNRLVVRIRVHVNDSGRPTKVTIVKPGPKAFNESAIECAMNERFHPALDMAGNEVEGDREVGILFFRTGSHILVQEATPPPPVAPPPPPMGGPQPDLPIQLDDSPPGPGEKPPPAG